MARDDALLLRVTACAADEGLDNPEAWAWSRQWQISAQPGWDAAYSYAITANNPNPGDDAGVITDAMILSAVQSLKAATP
jgi:hypothetical protein